MIPDYISTNLILFWIFFGVLSIMPMLLAYLAEKKDEKRTK